MKVKVISSRHSHIMPGMIGEAKDEDFPRVNDSMGIEVEFKGVENFTTKKPETVTVMMERQELEEYEPQ